MNGTPDELPAPSWRRRALVLLLALAVALLVMWALLHRPGDPKRGLPRAAPSAAGSAVGGKAIVTLLPAAPAASMPFPQSAVVNRP